MGNSQTLEQQQEMYTQITSICEEFINNGKVRVYKENDKQRNIFMEIDGKVWNKVIVTMEEHDIDFDYLLLLEFTELEEETEY